ncbi:hypothetical protein [Pantoea stewartii]|uniref:hypothetical protein n=1 Tax=Pantoea stewartii TaxID=66269 RepID=UPI0025A134DE|nr:hypothetical protein [Pantoea stewartii]
MAALEAISSADTVTMVSHVWLTIRSIPFVRWLMAEDSFQVVVEDGGADSLLAFAQFRF